LLCLSGENSILPVGFIALLFSRAAAQATPCQEPVPRLSLRLLARRYFYEEIHA